MKELKLILCDDDESMLDLIAKAISETFKRYCILSSIDTFTSVDDFYSAIKVYSYDIAFLDIDMPTLDGISLGIKMRGDGKNIPIVFVSSREDKMHDTFKIQPFAFIRKNCFLKDCDETVSRFANLFEKEAQKNFISLRMGNTVTNFNLSDIIYIESYNGCQYLHLKTISEPYRTRERMNVLEQHLCSHDFIRIHKGYIVNLDFVKRVDIDSITLKDNTVLPISRANKKDVRNKFLEKSRRLSPI